MPETALRTGHSFNLPFDNVDTDQIYPGRYLTTVKSQGLGQLCFYDWRNDPTAGKAQLFTDFDPQRQSILVAGDNFGCGSSREHAIWALLGMGIKAVISSKFADILRRNAENNGLLLITVDPEVLAWLHKHDDHPITIDLVSKVLNIRGLGTISFPIDEFTVYCVLHSIDALDYLLQQQSSIGTFEKLPNKHRT